MARFRKGQRRSTRTKAVVPMRMSIAGSPETHLVHTLDVSKHGVMLGGLRCELNVGDKIEVHHHHKRAQFRVVWVKTREGSKEKQIGAECMQPEKQFWDMEFAERPDEYTEEE